MRKISARGFSARLPVVMYCRLPLKSAKASVLSSMTRRKPSGPPHLDALFLSLAVVRKNGSHSSTAWDGMDRLAAIKVFVAIVEAGSLSAAGRRLGMPLSTVSRYLAALEDQVQVRLITRTTRDLVLTESGRHYLESCRRIVAELEAAELRLAGEHEEPQGELAVTAPVVFGRLQVLPVVVEFLRMSPRVTARLLLVDRTVDLHKMARRTCCEEAATRIGHRTASRRADTTF